MIRFSSMIAARTEVRMGAHHLIFFDAFKSDEFVLSCGTPISTSSRSLGWGSEETSVGSRTRPTSGGLIEGCTNRGSALRDTA